MKRTLLLATFLLSFSSFALAQNQSKTSGLQDTLSQRFLGYTIVLKPTNEGRYAYDIMQGNDLVLRQARNPFVPSLSGLRNKDDVFRVAQWQIQQFLSKSSPATVSQDRIPQQVALRLNIDFN